MSSLRRLNVSVLDTSLAARTLYAQLAEHVPPPKEILVPPLIALRNNIDILEQFTIECSRRCAAPGKHGEEGE